MSKEIWTSVLQILKILTPAVIESHILIRKNKEVAISQEDEVELAQAAGAENFAVATSETLAFETEANSEKVEEQTAQIIPIRPNTSLSDPSIEKLSDQTTPDVQITDDAQNELEAVGILGVNKLREQEEKARLIEKQKQESTSVFILNQRTKLRESKQKLVGQTAMKQYKKEMSGEHLQVRSITESNENLDDQAPNTSSSSGILVNKKQA